MFVRQETSFIYNILTGFLHGSRYDREGNYRTKYHIVSLASRVTHMLPKNGIP